MEANKGKTKKIELAYTVGTRNERFPTKQTFIYNMVIYQARINGLYSLECLILYNKGEWKNYRNMNEK